MSHATYYHSVRALDVVRPEEEEQVEEQPVPTATQPSRTTASRKKTS
jgi:hypothetical protein